jgi:glucose/arabinose dehydrogenase
MSVFKLAKIVISLIILLSAAACGVAGSSTTASPAPQPTLARATAAAANSPVPPTDKPLPTSIPPTAAATATRPAPTDPPTPANAAPTNTQASAPSNNSIAVDIQPLVEGLQRPTFITSAGDGTDRLFVVEQVGRIRIIENGKLRAEPFLNIQSKVTTGGNEQGLLGLAFHPDYKNNGLFYVNYSRKGNGDNVIEQYQVSADSNLADANSARVLLTIPGLEPNHNGGMLAFGPDGYLYIGAGDGGGAGDRHGTQGNGQSLNTLLGKILRIDVNGEPYKVPSNNPFVSQNGAQPEIWAYGLRNPWRFSFDRATDDLYIADVGQNSQEEVDFQPASSQGGENYGWRIFEGTRCYDAGLNCDQSGLVPPIATYSHDLGCSITGGYVYRGKQYPQLVGQYFFADYCTGIVWASSRDASGKWNTRQIGKFDDTISSFGEDAAGELYVVGHGSGTIYRLVSSG